MPTKTFLGQYKCLAEIGDFVSQVAQEGGFDVEQVYAVELAVDEACSNIIEHAYGGEGKGKIVCSCELSDDRLTITVQDWGKSFDPSDISEPNYEVPINELQNRGAGLFLMRKMMDDVSYQFSDSEGNLLTMVKYK